MNFPPKEDIFIGYLQNIQLPTTRRIKLLKDIAQGYIKIYNYELAAD
jgi:hypothetical protein